MEILCLFTEPSVEFPQSLTRSSDRFCCEDDFSERAMLRDFGDGKDSLHTFSFFAEKQILAGDSFEIIFPPEYTREDGTGRYRFLEGFSPSGAATGVDTLQFQSDGLTASLSSFSSSKPPGTKIVLQVSVNNPRVGAIHYLNRSPCKSMEYVRMKI